MFKLLSFLIDRGEKYFMLACIWHPIGQRLYLESLINNGAFNLGLYRAVKAPLTAIFDYYMIAPRMILMLMAAMAFSFAAIYCMM